MEMYTVKNDLSPKIFIDLFCETKINPYNLRKQHYFEVAFVRTVYHES